VFKGIDHVVIAVKDLDEGIKQYEAVYGIAATDRGSHPGFDNAFFRMGDTYVELVAPTDDTGPVGRRIAASGEGVYLMGLRVDDVQATLADLRAKGVRLVGDPGAGNPVTGMVFVHPSAAGGVLTQLVQR
jgi:methylmalonyl-CoA/ethylmalonyl-CoA epimerase